MSLRNLIATIICVISVLALAATGLLIYVGATAPTWQRAIELVALVPLAFPLGGLALVLALVLVPLTTRRRRWRAWCLATIALLAAAGAFAGVAPLIFGHKPAAESGRSLVIMTQNLEYGDPQSLAEVALLAKVDLLVVTDASATTVLRLRVTEIGRTLSHIVGLGQAGPEGSVVFSRYPLSDVTRISDNGDSRAVTAHTPHMGDVDLVALHPSPPYQKEAWIADYEQITAYLLNRDAGSAGRAGRPVVVAGDLNATLDHAPIRRIRELGFSDAVEQLNLGFQPTWPAAGSIRLFGIPVPPFVQIDHVLTSPALAATGLTTFHSDGTDHLGLCVELQRARA